MFSPQGESVHRASMTRQGMSRSGIRGGEGGKKRANIRRVVRPVVERRTKLYMVVDARGTAKRRQGRTIAVGSRLYKNTTVERIFTFGRRLFATYAMATFYPASKCGRARYLAVGRRRALRRLGSHTGTCGSKTWWATISCGSAKSAFKSTAVRGTRTNSVESKQKSIEATAKVGDTTCNYK